MVFPGMTIDSQNPTSVNICTQAHERGYNCAYVNWRGMAGMELKSPKWFGNASEDDLCEAIKFLIDKYQPSKVFAFGISLGASCLTKVLAKNEF